jgi:hypothetical protein
MSIRLALCFIFSTYGAAALYADSPEGSKTGRQSPSASQTVTAGASLVSQVQEGDQSIVLPEVAQDAALPVTEEPIVVPDANDRVQPMEHGIQGVGCTSAQNAFSTRRCDTPWGRACRSSQFSYQIWQGYAEQRAREEQHKIETVLSPCLGGNCSGVSGHGFKLHSKHWLPKHQINGARAGVTGNCDHLTIPVGPPVLPAAASDAESSFR